MARNPVGFRVTDAAAGWNGTDFDDLFIRKDCFLEGGLWIWGADFNGGLGRNSLNIAVSSPVQTVSGGTNWKQAASGANNVSVVKTDGTLWSWGKGVFGNLGNNTALSSSSPVQTVSGGTDWRQVSAWSDTVAALKVDGTLWLWSYSARGSLGNNTTAVSVSSPVQTVSAGTNWKQISVGSQFVSAIKTDGTLWTWGLGTSGQLGNNSAIDRSSPVQTVSNVTTWKQVSAGNNAIASIKTDGTLWTWGYGNYGRLGNNLSGTAIASRSSPVQTVSGGTNWKEASMTVGVGLGIKTDGTLWAWGSRTGDNTNIVRSSPVQTISGGTNWRSVARGSSITAAIKTDGTLWLWGSQIRGELGTGNTIAQSSPVQTISGGTNWRSIVIASNGAAVAIREDCW